MPQLPPDLEYRQIRDEIRAEHALVSNRLTWYATSQSFLVTAFTISRANGFTWHSWYSTMLLPALGLCASLLILPSIIGACKTIRLWHRKQKEFFARNPEYQTAFDLRRAQWIESRGLLFPQFMPLLFGSFWVIIFSNR
jgi:hypothetical protein